MFTRKTRRGQATGIAVIFYAFMLAWPGSSAAQISDTFTVLSPDFISASASDWQTELETYNPPQQAVLGTGETYCYWQTSGASEQWIQLDLGGRYRVGALEIYSTGNRMDGYRVYVSHDPDDPGDAVATGNLPDTSDYHPIVFTPAYGRYVTVIESSRHSANLRIQHMRVYVSFSLENPVNGNRGFTCTNVVNLADFPAPEGYDLYQITESDIEPAGGWLDYDPESPPEQYTFTIPPGEGLAAIYAWFADSAETLPTMAVPAFTTYLRANADVTAIAHTDFEAYAWGSVYPAMILVDELDNGSSASIGLYGLSLSSGTDLEPENSDRVVFSSPGAHNVTLTAMDLAGNISQHHVTVNILNGNLLSPQITAWTGALDTDNWFHHGNWSDGVPGPGSEVAIGAGAEILLTDDTAVMGTLNITGGTLDMQNWMTRLQAGTVNFTGGSIRVYQPISATHLFNFDDTEMSNRVWIVCNDYHQGSSADIDADGRGYRNPYGLGSTMGTYAPGGGHGGVGAWGRNRWENMGRAYGSLESPEAPGSGAGRVRFSRGGVGGGAVRIDATGAVNIEGIISANGTQGRANQGGGGSGGSVLINCNTFSGTPDGYIRADGGDARNSSGGGGGGRIAVIYNTTAQQQINPVFPPVRLGAKRGLGGNHNFMSEDGTLYLPDLLFLADGEIGEQFQDIHIFAPGLDEVEIPGNLIVAGLAGLPETRTLMVEGDMLMQPGSSLRLFGGPISESRRFYGSLLRVGGELLIEDSAVLFSTLYAINHIDVDEYDEATQTAGRGGVLFELGRLTVAAGGIIDSVGGGFWAASGPGAGSGTASGGSYGGLGGGDEPGPVYGMAHIPLLPGSGGSDITRAGRGGGLLAFTVRGLAHIDGLIRANGQLVRTDYNSGGSGGAIVLSCDKLTGEGELSARGANTRGGGGRIAVWNPHLSEKQYLWLQDTERIPTPNTWQPSDDPDFTGVVTGGWEEFSGTVSVEAEAGDPGSIFFARYYSGTIFIGW